jgi:hypothetical protein
MITRQQQRGYRGTLVDVPLLRSALRYPGHGLRDDIVLEPTDYLLAVEQRQGITLDRVKEIAAMSGH